LAACGAGSTVHPDLLLRAKGDEAGVAHYLAIAKNLTPDTGESGMVIETLVLSRQWMPKHGHPPSG